MRLLDPANRADPYPLYGQIRERGPLRLPARTTSSVFSSLRGTATRCCAIRPRPATGSSRRWRRRRSRTGAEPRPFGQPGFLFLDPPDHTRLRKLASKAFAPKVVKALEPDIVGLVDALLDDVEPGGTLRCDRRTGPPAARRGDLPAARRADRGRAAVQPCVGAVGAGHSTRSSPSPENGRPSSTPGWRPGLWLRGYLRDLIDERRSSPREDLISALIAAEEDGDQLTAEEIVATCNLLLIAGHETTVNLIANAILALLRHPRHWAAVGADPHRAAAVAEETLRYDPPVQLVGRIAAEDMIDRRRPRSQGRHHDAASRCGTTGSGDL